MVKLVTMFKKGKQYGGLSGKRMVDEFRTIEEAKRQREFIKGEYVSSVIIARKPKSQMQYSPFGRMSPLPKFKLPRL